METLTKELSVINFHRERIRLTPILLENLEIEIEYWDLYLIVDPESDFSDIILETRKANTLKFEYFSDEFYISILEPVSDAIITFSVSADTGTMGRFFIVSIGNSLVNNIVDIKVSFDEQEDVSKMSVNEFLDSNNVDCVVYILLTTNEEVFLMIYIPYYI